MNKKFFLTLLSSPVLFMSVLSMAIFSQPASANETVNPTRSRFSCGRKTTVAVATPSVGCTRLRRNSAASDGNTNKGLRPGELPELEFTDEESDASVTLFGCDCPACLNALRQIRGLPPLAV